MGLSQRLTSLSIFLPSMVVAYIFFGAIICATTASDVAFKNMPGIGDCNITDVNRTTEESYVLTYACKSVDDLMYTIKLSYVPDKSLVIDVQCTDGVFSNSEGFQLSDPSLLKNNRSDLSPLVKSLLTMKMTFLNCSIVSFNYFAAYESGHGDGMIVKIRNWRNHQNSERSSGWSQSSKPQYDVADFSEQPEIIFDLSVAARNMKKSSIISVERMKNLTNLLLDAPEVTLDDIEFVKNLDKLESLALSKVRANTIPSGFFDKMVNLERLAMEGSQLSTLDEGLFLKNEKLQIIAFPDSNISSIDSKAFDGPKELKHIYINGHSIDKEQIEALRSRLNLTIIQASPKMVYLVGSG